MFVCCFKKLKIFFTSQITSHNKIKYVVAVVDIFQDNLWGFSIFRMSAKATKVAKNTSDKGNCTKYHHNALWEWWVKKWQNLICKMNFY